MAAAMNPEAANAEWSRWPAPAKLNLFLHITGRRADGYHMLQSVFQLLDWGDRIRIRLRNDAQIRRLPAEGYTVPEAVDLAIRAAVHLQKSANIAKGVDICVEKHVPMGGGFGGGSSDAATVLVALNCLWNAGMSENDLAGLGLQLGADVPVFVRGRNAWAEGVGELLTPIALPEAAYLIVDSGVSVPTGELFQAPELTRDAAPATISDFVSGTVRGNAFEPVLRRLHPAVDSALSVLSQYGEACLTGTGGGCFVRFATREAAETALRSLPPGPKAWVAMGAPHSPLLDAVAAFRAGEPVQ
jgi:4-diphosphocytidyl-2-C-methyl-D-erythritol kinase